MQVNGIDDFEYVKSAKNAELSDESGLCTEILEEIQSEELYESSSKAGIFNAAKDLLGNESLSFLFLDSNLKIIDISPAMHKMFKDYYTIEKKPFFNVFGNILEKENLSVFLNRLKSVESGYSWAGVLVHKIRTAKTFYTRVNIMPLFSNKTVVGYWAVFEDISDAYLSHYKNTFSTLIEASKLKDNDTGYHNERLNHYSKLFTEELYKRNIFYEIDVNFIDMISFLAAMHDVGKIGTPDYILHKPGKLDETEWKVMKEHTINGALILSNCPFKMAKEIALSHHEMWNGNGYPYGLAGEMIPLSARIVTIADVYDALRMKRSYKEPFTHEQTVEYIINQSTIHFDPKLISVFKEIHLQFDEIWNKLTDKV